MTDVAATQSALSPVPSPSDCSLVHTNVDDPPAPQTFHITSSDHTYSVNASQFQECTL